MINRRQALLLAPAAILAAGMAGAFAFIGLRDEPAVPIGGPFALQDGDGRTITDAQFRGRWMLVYFGYTHCPDACPTALNDMATALDQLGDRKKDVVPVFITVDPERDTPAVMKDYVGAFGTPIAALSGSRPQVEAAMKAYRVYAARHPTKDGYDMDHSSIIYVMDPQGRLGAIFTHETSPDQIAAKLKELRA